MLYAACLTVVGKQELAVWLLLVLLFFWMIMKWVTYQRRCVERARQGERNGDRGGGAYSAVRHRNHPMMIEDSHVQLISGGSGELQAFWGWDSATVRVFISALVFVAKTASRFLFPSFLFCPLSLPYLTFDPSPPLSPRNVFHLRRWGICPRWPPLLLVLYAAECIIVVFSRWYLGSGKKKYILLNQRRFGNASLQQGHRGAGCSQTKEINKSAA